MSRIINFLSVSCITFLSFPLISFALFTTSIALVTLLIRVSVLYVELVLALIRSAINPSTAEKQHVPFQPHSFEADEITRVRPHPRSRRASQQSFSSTASSSPLQIAASGPTSTTTPQLGAVNNAHWPIATPGPRDYEGVGGWRFPTSTAEDETEEALWTRINSRLELPALCIPSPTVMSRPRTYSNGTKRGGGYSVPGSALTSGAASPLMSRSPAGSRRGRRGRKSGTASPEGYFGSMSGIAPMSEAAAGDRGGSDVVRANSMEALGSSRRRDRSAKSEDSRKTPSSNSSVSLVKLSFDG